MTITRRQVLSGVGTVAAVAVTAKAEAAQWVRELGYPDPRVRILDPSFMPLRVGNTPVQQLGTGFLWAEGPVWFGDGRYVLFSDIPNNRIMKWDEISGQFSVFREPANNTNGHARDRQGRLLSCEHDARRLSRTEYDGTITTVADTFDGKPLNSPNDVVVKSDDSIWFTDPAFGIGGWYEGHRADRELPTNVYRVDGQTGAITLAATDISPNGLAFSPDEKILYITDSTLMPRGITAFDVNDDGTLTNRRAFMQSADGSVDGFRVDIAGNIWASWGNNEEDRGVKVFNPAGLPIGHIQLPERAANLCFMGKHRSRLFITASQSIYAVYTNTQSAVLL